MSLQGMRPKDAEAFKAAAGWFELYILVRATNPASLIYMDKPDRTSRGEPGYSAKRLDCKAKTADNDVVLNGRSYSTAGLVVDPRVVGPGAYNGEKHGKALKEWSKFEPLVAQGIHDAAGQPVKTYFPGGKLYGVQMDPTHKHYGCVMFSSGSLISAATYVHGDYDLYAVVPADNPRETIFVQEERIGEKHMRGRELTDLQTFVNRRLGRPMVLHGDQEKYAEHSDEEVYAFFPDGRTLQVLSGRGEIEHFYATVFGGRKTGGKHAVTEPAGGLWQRVR